MATTNKIIIHVFTLRINQTAAPITHTSSLSSAASHVQAREQHDQTPKWDNPQNPNRRLGE